jgi:sensor histidine kinase YesM
MTHPFIANRRFLIIYLSVLMVIGIGIFLVLALNNPVPWWYALSDSFVNMILFGGMGLGVWYMVVYTDPDEMSRLQFLANHLAAALIFISLWLFVGGVIVHLFVQSPDYFEFYESSYPGRTWTCLLLYVLLVLFYYLIVYYRNFREKVERTAQLESMVKESELKALKSQINPHFLFNSLNSIASLTMTQPDRAREMVVCLSEFMRYSLKSRNEDKVTLNQELHNIELYLKIEKVRFGRKLLYQLDIGEGAGDCLVPNLILQPVFENAIKYGVYEAVEPVQIRLKALVGAEFLVLDIENDFDPESVPTKGEGVGLRNIGSRLRVMYGRSGLLDVERRLNTFHVHMKIPRNAVETPKDA